MFYERGVCSTGATSLHFGSVCGGDTHQKGFLEKATTKLDLQPQEKRQAGCKEPSTRAPGMYTSKRKGHKVTRALLGREGRAPDAAGEAGQGQGLRLGILLLVGLDFVLRASMGCKLGWGSRDVIYFQDKSLWSGMWGEKSIRSLRQEDRRGGSSSPQMGGHTRGMAGERSSRLFRGRLGEGGEGNGGVETIQTTPR